MNSVSSLSRTSPHHSACSSDDTASRSTVAPSSASRRTRKRFSNAHLTMLENLFHQNSHPSREDRETLAKAGDMEIKSVTIWFQNKRQTERKVAASAAASSNPPSTSPSSFGSCRSKTSATSTSPRPSLDFVASRSELRAPAPRTPGRRHNPIASLWDNMPSSPLGPSASPPVREYVDFSAHPDARRTLEWACAAARLEKQAGGQIHSRDCALHAEPVDAEMTEDEAEEVLTPSGTWGKDDERWRPNLESNGVGEQKHTPVAPCSSVTVEGDDELMRAALALCGLGRR